MKLIFHKNEINLNLVVVQWESLEWTKFKIESRFSKKQDWEFIYLFFESRLC